VDHPFANLEDFASRPAVVTPAGEVVSYADLAARADALAAPMRACRGLLALEAANDLDPLLAFVGACRAGCPVMLLGPGDLDANPHLRERFRPDHEYRRHDGDGWKLTGGGGPAADDLHPDLAVLLSTSGSTGSAKLVRLSAGNIVANARSIAEYLGIDGRERAITALPMQYSFGMSIVTSHLMAGASLVLTDRSVLDACFWDVFRAHGCTSFSGVPRTFEILRQNGVLERDLPGLRTVTQAGGRLAPEHVRAVGDWAASQGARFFVMYGQTEAAPRMSYLPPERLHDGADCIGMAIPGGELLLRDDDGAVIDTPDTPGELCYRGPNVMMGYAAHRADFARGAELDELRTGDIARRRLDGLFRIVGRASRFVKIVGLRVGLDDVEALLRREGVAACVAGDDTRVVAAVEDGARDTDALKADLVARLHLPATAVEVVHFPQLPVLPSGKPDYKAVLAAGAGADHDTGAVDLRARLASILHRDHLEDHETFMSAGGDSLSYVEGALVVEAHFGRAVTGWEHRPMADLCGGDIDVVEAEHRDGGRLDPLLVSRALAIALALTSHAFLRFGIWRHLPQDLRMITRVATPAFLIIFGLGLARAYLGRPEGRRPGFILRRSWPKIITIYAAIVMIQTCAVLGRNTPWAESWKGLLFMDAGVFVDILALYCSLYLLAPLLVAAAERWRAPAVAVMFAIPWAAWPLLTRMESPGYFISYLTGMGGAVGPSVLHATSFVLLGYCLGAVGRRRSVAAVGAAALAAGIGVATAYAMGREPADLVQGLASMELRRQNHPFYAAYGALGSLAILGLGALLVRTQPWSRWRLPFALGANSIFAFAVGNMMLNLVTSQVLPLPAGLAAWVVFLTVITLLTDDVMRPRPRFFGHAATLLRGGMTGLLGLSRRVPAPVPRPRRR
jgi:acyl-CoA synthetase (AMP-forming)/AMP-acid ligase II/surface polysaccharide O-acyltransferase-like enzyme